jgi:4-amino-4-deoxy-L-arabinose transferase-like glycosyltransferase
MSVAAAPTSPNAFATRFANRPLTRVRVTDAVALGALGLWSLVLLIATWGTWGDPTMDTGYDLLAASRTAHGELPYADYVYAYGPVGPFLLGGIYAITGVAVWPAVALGIVLAVAVIGLTYLVARLLVGPGAAALAGALVATLAFSSANNSYVLPHSTSAPLVTALVLGMVLCLASGRERAAGSVAPRSALGAGLLLGLAAITRLEIAVPVGFGVLVWLGFTSWRWTEDRAAIRASALRIVVPALAIPLVVYGLLLTQVSLHDLLYENLYPRSLFEAGGHVLIDAEMPLTVGSVVALAGRFALYVAGVAAVGVVVVQAARSDARGRIARAALLAGAMVVLALLLAKPETVRFYLRYAYLWIPAGAAAGTALLAWRAWRAPRSREEQVALLAAAILTAVTIKGYAAFDAYPNAKFPARASVYLLPLAAPLLAWLHTRVLPGPAERPVASVARAAGMGWLALLVAVSAGLAVRDAGFETETVSGSHGSLTARPSQGRALQGAVDAIEGNTRSGDTILVAPQLTALYVLTDRTAPLPQLSLLPGALADDAAQDRAIAAMSDVRLVVADRTPLAAYGHGAFGATFDRRIAAWLRTDFHLLKTVKGDGTRPRLINIWIRTSA